MELPTRAAADSEANGIGKSSSTAAFDAPRQLVLRSLVEVLVEQGGARRGAYLSVGDRVEVEAAVGIDDATVGFPVSVLERARHSRADVILDDATLPSAFSADEYLMRRRPRSVACLPVVQHDDVIGLVYLENDLLPGMFTQARVEKLELLAMQIGQFSACASTYAELQRMHAEQRRARAALRASREQLQAVLDNMVDGVFVCDATGRLTLVNEAAIRLLGVGSADLLRTLGELAEVLQARHPDGRPFTWDELPLVRALRGEIVSAIDATISNPRTQRDTHLRLNAAPIQDERGAIIGAVAAAANVTEMLELDHLKDEFLRIAAHELKTPVAIVKGYAETFRRSAKDFPPAQRQMLEALVRGADRVDRITSNLLLLQQLRTGRVELVIEPLDLAELAETAVRRLEPDPASGRVKVSPRGPVIVLGDRQLLGQVLVNLLANALRYSPGGGEVDVTVHGDEREAVVAVNDQGVGIPREKQARLFEPFYRAHADTPYDYGGMGGGLYLAKAIITRHGGVIGFTSEEGRGSTFTIQLPRHRSPR